MGIAFAGEKPSILRDITFRPLSPELVNEAEQAIEQFRANFKATLEMACTTRTFKSCPSYPSDRLRRQISEGRLKGRLAFHKGRVVGLVAYTPDIDVIAGIEHINVKALWVHADARRQGLGVAMLAHACLDEKKPAFIGYDQNNQEAVGFYEWLRRTTPQGLNHGARALTTAKFLIYKP